MAIAATSGQPAQRMPLHRLLDAALRLGPSGLVGAIVTAVYTVFSALQWASHAILSWDLGIFTQLARDYAAFQAPIVPIKGPGFNLLGDHFHPLLVLLGPVYALFPHAFTLLVVQNVLFGFAAAVISWVATGILHSKIMGVLIGLSFGFSWGLQGAVEAQFHEIAFAVPLLALSLAFFLQRRWLACALWAAPLVFVKEDLGLTVLVVGLVLFWRSRTPIGLWLSAWGVAWFAIATFIVLPMLNPQGRWAYSGSLDLKDLFTNPGALFHWDKVETLWLLVIIGAGILVRSPLALALVPTLAWRFLSTNSGYWGHTWQYSAVLMPIALCAALDAVARLRASRHDPLRHYSTYAPTVMVVVAAMLIPQLSLGKLADPGANFPIGRSAAADGALSAVPSGASVESDIGLMSYLVDRTTVYWIGNANPVPDYLAIDLRGGGLPQEWNSIETVEQQLHPGASFRTVYSRDGYEVARRTASAVPRE